MNGSHIDRLRRRLLLEAPERTPDEGGGAEMTWTAVATLWCAIEDRGGGVHGDADGARSRATHAIHIRFRDGVVPGQRFRRDTRTYDIRAVLDPDGRRRWLTCLCVVDPG